MNTIIKYIILIIVIIVLFLVGKSIFSVHIDDTKSAGEVVDDVKAGMGNMASDVKDKTDNLMNKTSQDIDKSQNLE